MGIRIALLFPVKVIFNEVKHGTNCFSIYLNSRIISVSTMWDHDEGVMYRWQQWKETRQLCKLHESHTLTIKYRVYTRSTQALNSIVTKFKSIAYNGAAFLRERSGSNRIMVPFTIKRFNVKKYIFWNRYIGVRKQFQKVMSIRTEVEMSWLMEYCNNLKLDFYSDKSASLQLSDKQYWVVSTA